jgi:hypothetical protein
VIYQLVGIVLAALAAVFVADAVVERRTGKHIPEHVYGWWCDLCAAISAWQANHRHLAIASFIGRVTENLDHVASQAMVIFSVVAKSREGVEHQVTTRRVPVAELRAKFPGLTGKNEVILDLSHVV